MHRPATYSLALFLAFLLQTSLAQNGNYLSLDGSSGYVIVDDHHDLDIDTGEDYTITCWVRSSSITGFPRMIHKRVTGAGTGYELMADPAGNYAVNFENTGNTNVGSPAWSMTAVLDGTWHHAAMVVNTADNSNTLYIDGIVQPDCTSVNAQIGSTNFANAVDLYFGFDTFNNSYLHGCLDEIRFWSNALTSEDILDDMENVLIGSEANLIAAWDFENVVDQTVPDLSDNDHPGTLVGGASVIDPNEPMTYLSTTLEQTTLPTGRGNENARVLLLNVQTTGALSPIGVSNIDLTIGDTDLSNIINVNVYFTGSSNRLNMDMPFGSASPSVETVSVSGFQTLTGASNYFWVTYDISPDATEGDVIDATCEAVTVDGNVETLASTIAEGERVILLDHGTLYSFGEYNSTAYRIPAICTAPDGSLIAAGDARIDNNTDLPGNIDISLRRSEDNGMTWSDPIVIADFGDDGASDPALVIDAASGDVICLFATHSGLFGSTPMNPIRMQVCRSSDNGATWTSPEDITDQVYAPGWHAVWVASGSAHQMASGRIVAAVGVRPNSSTQLDNHMIFSDDGGLTWAYMENTASANGNEAKILEINNGDLMMNIRAQNQRKIVISSDDGETWGTPYLEPELIDPFCNADFIRYTSTLNGFDQNRILFSNPKSTSLRENLHVFMSTDEADTWPYSKLIYDGPSAYSSLTILNDGSIGLFYENGEYEQYQLSFARFSLDWLTDGADTYTDPIIGVPDLSQELSHGLRIHPNPTTGKFGVKVEGVVDSILVSITSIDGSLVREQKFENGSALGLHQFDLSSFSKGTYMVKMESRDQTVVSKIVLN